MTDEEVLPGVVESRSTHILHAAARVIHGLPLPDIRMLPYAHAIKHIATAWVEHEALHNLKGPKPGEDTPPGGGAGGGGRTYWHSIRGEFRALAGSDATGSRPGTEPDPHDKRVLDEADQQQPCLTDADRERLEEFLERTRRIWLTDRGFSPKAR